MVASDLRREVVGDPDAAGAQQYRGADGGLVERGLAQEVLLDDAEPGGVARPEPVQGEERVVVPHAVRTTSVGGEVRVTLDEEGQVVREWLGDPDAADDREPAVLRGPEAGEDLQVRVRGPEGELGSEVPEHHRRAADRAEDTQLRVEGAADGVVDLVLREGPIAQDEQDLAVGLPLGLGGRGDEHRAHEQEREEALHRSLQCGSRPETGH